MKQSLIFWLLIAPSLLLCTENTKEQLRELETFRQIKLKFCKINSRANQHISIDQQNQNLESLLKHLQSLKNVQPESRDSLSKNIQESITTNMIMKKHLFLRDNKPYLDLDSFKSELRLNGLLE